MQAFTKISNQRTQNDNDKSANKITRLMGLSIMQASKNIRSKRMLRIFGRSNGISKTFVKYMNQLGMRGYSISVRNYP